MTAGIAAYKTATLVREFDKNGWDVHVVPTRASLNFVGEATWQELSGNPVTCEVFSSTGSGHVRLAKEADLIVVAPATADFLGRLRAGLADDLLTTTILASPAPVVLAPAMHTQMWTNPATVDNVAVLRARGYHVLDPDRGALSSGDEGVGRMPDPQQVFTKALEVARESSEPSRQSPAGFHVPTAGETHSKDRSATTAAPLRGRRVVITAGGTQEAIDPVRFIGNRSSGHQGTALVRAAAALGAEVTLVAASVTAPIPASPNVQVVRVNSSADMAREVYARLDDADVLIMAAAVSDFTPVAPAEQKIKKEGDGDGLKVELRRTEDILATVARSERRPAVLIGFGAETGSKTQVLDFGAQKARAKGADLLAVNQVGDGLGFGNVPNTLVYFDANGKAVGGATGSKDAVAADLLQHAVAMLRDEE